MATDTTAFYKELGQRLSRARQAARLKQEDLARIVGLSRTSLSNVEQGRQPVQAHTLVQLAQALGVSVMSLLPVGEGTEDQKEHPALGGLSAETRAWVERVIAPPPAEGADDGR